MILIFFMIFLYEYSISSALMQQFLSEILECLFTNDINLKTASFDVLYVILEQGLVHPLKVITYIYINKLNKYIYLYVNFKIKIIFINY